MLGFRALSVKYEQGSARTKYDYDVVQYGPVMGVSVKFLALGAQQAPWTEVHQKISSGATGLRHRV
jgi:hypothetical protein